MAVSFALSVSPRNFSVMCMFSARTHFACGATARNSLSSAARAARTSGGISMAMNRRMGLDEMIARVGDVGALEQKQMKDRMQEEREEEERRQGLQSLPALHLGARLGVEQEMYAHHVQGDLRGVKANRLAIAGQMHDALFHSFRGSEGDVHRANWFFFAATAGPSDTRDANSQRASNAPPNAFGKGDGHFAADRALRLDQGGGHFGPGGLHLIAVANRSTQKITGTSGNAGQAFGEQSARAAFRRRNGGAISGKDFGDDLLKRDGRMGEDAITKR